MSWYKLYDDNKVDIAYSDILNRYAIYTSHYSVSIDLEWTTISERYSRIELLEVQMPREDSLLQFVDIEGAQDGTNTKVISCSSDSVNKVVERLLKMKAFT